ncbi:hypothetical protein [Nonlabens xiamenensis]|uniref:hypothetical protein n=1 Tax=Nonlabens xiamenensis TaxID=2341043 RepID=UPI000F60CE57|nr:hypothetical protein [Nonlabens xiamenensis]
MILKNLLYEFSSNGDIDLFILLENEILSIKDLKLSRKKYGEDLTIFKQYEPIKNKVGSIIEEIKVDWYERDLRIKLSDGSFITLFRYSENEYMLDIFEKSEIDEDFIDAFENDSDSIFED